MKRTVVIPALFAALSAVVLSGCSSTPSGPEQTGAAVENRATDDNGAKVATVDNAGSGLDAAALAALRDPKNILSKRSIYFDFDRFDIKTEYKDLVGAHAKFISEHKAAKVLIQGNTDERGSREYNLALGQKRADAVKKGLALLGAKEEQLESVSLGEEKPKSEGHDEAAWAENRRSDILYNGEY
jgi:peptidoglycan-associated lipoprotein